MTIVEVLLPLPNVPLLYYSYAGECEPGDLILVPFRKKEVVAIVWRVNPEDPYEGSLKSIIKKLSYSLTSTFLDFIKKTQSYYIADLGSIAKMVLPI